MTAAGRRAAWRLGFSGARRLLGSPVMMPAAKKVLIVDDHESILAVLEKVLATPCLELFRAGSGEEAMRVVRREHPDAVLVDVCMPGMDGLEVCDAIRADPGLAGTRVILMSAILGDTAIRDGGEDVGADGYLAKPFDPVAVREGVAMVLGAKR